MKFYLTTTIPYVNAAPHMGHALEFVQADAIARYERIKGSDVVFNIGTDEHGDKIYRKAAEQNKDPQTYVDEYAEIFRALAKQLNLSNTSFIRTTDPHHKAAAQEFWKRCAENGDIYKSTQKILYCVGCELEKTDSELEGGACPVHPNLKIEEREEENYFFRFSKYAEALRALYRERPDFVVPDFRLREIDAFIATNLHDFSISRLKAKMPWGVPVPNDEAHVMYVWFDALVNYISTLGWPEDEANFKAYWPGMQIAGKDNLRQQSAMWQAMLMSAKLLPSKQILIHGFITSNGEKMSKSLGNVADPLHIMDKYGTDALRYWLLRDISPFEDGDFTWEKFDARYEADLANGLGNFTARVLALAEKAGILQGGAPDAEIIEATEKARKTVAEKMAEFRFHEALASIWELISFGDAYINKTKPWNTNDTRAIYNAVVILDNVASLIAPFLPETAEKITKSIVWKSPSELTAKKLPILFPRKD
jgi:methionyl-tRNA synthetase